VEILVIFDKFPAICRGGGQNLVAVFYGGESNLSTVYTAGNQVIDINITQKQPEYDGTPEVPLLENTLDRSFSPKEHTGSSCPKKHWRFLS
jgi:hypothetical protein